MEHWHTNTTPYQREPSDLTLASRVLTSSSGNVQSYTPDSKDGIENQDPLRLPRPSEPWPKQEIQYPIPDMKLGSNDAHTENLAHLQQRRLNYRDKFFRKRRADPAKPYLQHPKYIQYRARQRCDTGPDGKPVWDDRIEDAFQNGTIPKLMHAHKLTR
jgi:transcriptional enhancer factor